MANSPVKQIAFIGAGLMGAPMTLRLLRAGFAVRVWNRTPAKLDALVGAGATPASTPAAAASGVDAVLLCLSDAAAIDAVLFSDEGVSMSHPPPSLLVDLSSTGPGTTLALAGRLHARCGTSWVDAPVSGGVVGAEQGKLVIFSGGPAADVDRLTAVFAALSQRHTRIGELAAGQTLKLCNQLIVASNLAAIAESLALARAGNLDLNLLPQSLAGGFADSLPLQIFGPRMAAGSYKPILGELSLMLKDLRAVDELARATDCRLPLMQATLRIYLQAAEQGLLHEDVAALFSLYSPPTTR